MTFSKQKLFLNSQKRKTKSCKSSGLPLKVVFQRGGHEASYWQILYSVCVNRFIIIVESVIKLAWFGRGLKMTLLYALRSLTSSGLSFILPTNWDHVFFIYIFHSYLLPRSFFRHLLGFQHPFSLHTKSPQFICTII